MFCLFFTTPGRRAPGGGQAEGEAAGPSAYRTLVTWALLFIWSALMCLGVLTMLQPPWLRELGVGGRRVEARSFAGFGDHELRDGNYRKAISQYEQSLRIQPDQPRVRVHLAIAWIKAGETEKGERMLDSALEEAPSDPFRGVIYYNLAESLEGRGRIEEAIQYYQQALGFYAEEDRVYRKLGTLHFQRAEQTVKQVRSLSGPELADAQRRAAQDIEQARQAFEKALAGLTDPTLPYKRMLYERLAAEEPEFLPAIEKQLMAGVRVEDLAPYDLKLIQETLQGDQELAKMHNYLGSIYGQLGQFAKAEGHFKESLQIWPGNTDAARSLERLRQMQSSSP